MSILKHLIKAMFFFSLLLNVMVEQSYQVAWIPFEKDEILRAGNGSGRI